MINHDGVHAAVAYYHWATSTNNRCRSPIWNNVASISGSHRACTHLPKLEQKSGKGFDLHAISSKILG